VPRAAGRATSGGLEEFVAEVLPENEPMLKVFERRRLVMTMRRERDVVPVTPALAGTARTG